MAGIFHNDRKQGARVRRLLLNEVEKILTGDDEVAKKEILMKMCTTLLPRLNEHSGEDGEPIKINVVNYGNNNSLSVSAESLPTALTSSTSEIQDSSDSPTRGEIEDSIERTDSQDPA